ncbi:ANTAR domain-containing protein [Arthrobacter sp. NamB2]|uniref:ANTAR domain-containing protein n=1 Tax=Arthrobacter sp. NamB2 TaxID=2576035 RepID=UPI0010C9B57B|nr:ANTAR domain-containing protein [Arthrobacter sp. NamB2]
MPAPRTFSPESATRGRGVRRSRCARLGNEPENHVRNPASRRSSGSLGKRTALDLAVGIMMAKNRCFQEQALSILKRSAETQDVPVRLIAERIVSTVNGDAPETHFTT